MSTVLWFAIGMVAGGAAVIAGTWLLLVSGQWGPRF